MADTPGVLESTAPVVEQAVHVKIDWRRLVDLCRAWAERPFPVPPWDRELHWSDGSERAANYVLLLDALNFCFWPDPGEERWEVEVGGRRLGGYAALAAALRRAVEEGVPVWDAGWLAELSARDLAEVLRGRGRPPMFRERLANAREVGRVLVERWEGSFARMVEEAGGSAVRLVGLLEEELPSFRDRASYGGREVVFLKRAQICAVDLSGTFGGRGWGAFRDLGRLTAFADYKIPQVLRALGVLVYGPELAAAVDAREEIPAGDPREVEIRACMVWAVEWIRRELAARGQEKLPYEIDWHLWNLGQQRLPGERPYHRTRTIFY